MVPRPDFYPAEPSEVPGPDLFMTVIKVEDWERVVAWYVDTLGLLVVLHDAERRFALLAAGSGRLAIQGDPEPASPLGSERARLVFAVPDVEAERARLIEHGVDPGPVEENNREGFREIRLHDPAGTPLTLFSWTRREGVPRLDHPPE
jgi:catechol 2,3-dioxygenase-like lactoylglutathione lyase family enzyme